MHKKFNFNSLLLIAAIFSLSSCNSDTNEPKEFKEFITYYGLNIEVNLKTKYFDSEIHYIVDIEDISENHISETEYFEKLKGGSLVLDFLDRDGFVLDTIVIEVINFTNIVTGEKVLALNYKNSEFFSKDKYNNVSQIDILTRNMQ